MGTHTHARAQAHQPTLCPCLCLSVFCAGVELCSIDRLNLLQLAPGGTIGRFVIWWVTGVGASV